jgi:Nucleotidyl transferase AbiEii toxin, Type IV TA system
MSLEQLERAAIALGEIAEEVVFLGGASIALWISDPAAPATRATDDVDVIADIASLSEYYALGARLRAGGFSEATNSKVICRWYHESGLLLDVMPQDEDILGFSNQWYDHAIEKSIWRTLPSRARVRAATPPSIVATKLAAWHGRGNGDMLRSLDLHDILVLIDGRAELAVEIEADAKLRSYLATELGVLKEDSFFPYLVESALHGYGQITAQRAVDLETRIDELVTNTRGL